MFNLLYHVSFSQLVLYILSTLTVIFEFFHYLFDFTMFSEKGKQLKIINDFKFHSHKNLANDVAHWTRTNKKCSAFIKFALDRTVINEKNDHAHEPDGE